MRRCSAGFTSANGSRALKRESRKMAFAVPWYASDPGLVMTSIRPRPGRLNSAANGSWLILISLMADALTPMLGPGPSEAGAAFAAGGAGE